MSSFFQFIRNCCLFFSRTDVFCLLLLWFMLILIIGTIAQQNIGLYSVQHKYFKSFIIWFFGCLPVPGGMLVLMLIFFGLTCKILTSFNLKKISTHIIHFGILVMLFGGFLTTYFSKEGLLVVNNDTGSSMYVNQNAHDIIISKNGNIFNRLLVSELSTYKLCDNISISFINLLL